jgi:hypothetical protein
MAVKTSCTSKGFPIVSPYDGRTSLFRVYFGKSYLIWKGKSLIQSINLLGSGIRTATTKEISDDHYLYHVVSHIKKTRTISGRVEILANDYEKDNNSIDGFRLLKDEQIELDNSNLDHLCLNNNVQSYVPVNVAYISEKDKTKFLNWYEKRIK